VNTGFERRDLPVGRIFKWILLGALATLALALVLLFLQRLLLPSVSQRAVEIIPGETAGLAVEFEQGLLHREAEKKAKANLENAAIPIERAMQIIATNRCWENPEKCGRTGP
jgi:hypothetical protein